MGCDLLKATVENPCFCACVWRPEVKQRVPYLIALFFIFETESFRKIVLNICEGGVLGCGGYTSYTVCVELGGSLWELVLCFYQWVLGLNSGRKVWQSAPFTD